MMRVGMMNPDTMLPIQKELVRVFRSPKNISILTYSSSIRFDEKFSKAWAGDIQRRIFLKSLGLYILYPNITIITDAIVGFPGETEIDFRDTLGLIESLQPDKVNITRFSPRPGILQPNYTTCPTASRKTDQEDSPTLARDSSPKEQASRGRGSGMILVTERGRKGTMKARANNYLGIVVHGTPALGAFIKVKVTASNANFLSGQVLPWGIVIKFIHVHG